MTGRSLTRRELLRLGAMVAAAVGLSALLAACGGGGPAGGDGSASECPSGGIRITAPVGAAVNGFDQTELRAPAGGRFTVCFDNRDGGVPHNFAAYTQQGGDVLGQTEVEQGPTMQTLELGPLDAGEYWYQCDVHPITMTGTLIVG